MDDQPRSAIPVPQVSRVGIDLPCISCGYNLRSLPMSGRCPECNSPIEEALHHGWLMFADPQWLARLRSGVTLILWSLLAAVICYFALVIGMVVFFLPSGQPKDLQFLQWPMLAVGLGLWTAWLVSVVRLTTPEPGGTAGEGPRRGMLAKWIVAFSAAPILSVLISALSFNAMLMPLPKLLFSDPWFISRFVVSNAANLAGMAGFFLLLIQMRRIARRHTAKGLGKLMTTLIWGSVALGVGWLAVVAAAAAMGFYAMSTGAFPTTTTSAPAGFAALGYASPPAATSQWTSFFRVGLNASTTKASVPATRPVTPTTNATTAPLTSRPTTGPAATMPTPPALPPRPLFPTGGWMILGLFMLLLFEFGTFGWMICGIVALFWFRSVFSRAIRQNATAQPTVDL